MYWSILNINSQKLFIKIGTCDRIYIFTLTHTVTYIFDVGAAVASFVIACAVAYKRAPPRAPAVHRASSTEHLLGARSAPPPTFSTNTCFGVILLKGPFSECTNFILYMLFKNVDLKLYCTLKLYFTIWNSILLRFTKWYYCHVPFSWLYTR